MKTEQATSDSARNATYTVKEVSDMLKVSIRKAYDLCNTTQDFRVIRIGRCLRVVKPSFDDWFDRCNN